MAQKKSGKGKGKAPRKSSVETQGDLVSTARSLAQSMMKEAGKVPGSGGAKLAAGESLLRRYRNGLRKAQQKTGESRSNQVNETASKFVQWVQTRYFDPVEDAGMRDARRHLNRLADQLAHGKDNDADWGTEGSGDAPKAAKKKGGKKEGGSGGDDGWATVGATNKKGRASVEESAAPAASSTSQQQASSTTSKKKKKGKKGGKEQEQAWEEVPKKGRKGAAPIAPPADAIATAAAIAGSKPEPAAKSGNQGGRTKRASTQDSTGRGALSKAQQRPGKKKPVARKSGRTPSQMVVNEDKEATSASLLYISGAVLASLCAAYAVGMLDMFM